MTLEEIRAALATALALKPPRWTEDTPPAVKIGLIETYLMESAYSGAELEEAVHYLDFTMAQLRQKIEQITGYEAVLPSKAADRITKADVIAAKRTLDPVTFDAGAEARQIRESLVRQLDRYEREAKGYSRLYTVITGS